MTPNATGRPEMLVQEFEALARAAPETVTLEFVDGRIGVKPVPDGDHASIVMWLLKRCMRQRPELALYPEQGLQVGEYRGGRARPDGALAPEDHFAGRGEWSDPAGVLMVVEVTSPDRDADSRDRREKLRAYAAAGLPVYLLIDRDSCTVNVHSRPATGGYRSRDSYAYGDVLVLPAPVNITLETDKLKDYAR